MKRALLLLLVLFSAVSLHAQATTGTLVGTVTTSDGAALPGVTVTISSPALQGTRTTVSGDTGGYYFPSLPPGPYAVTFDLEGMQRTTRKVPVTLAQTSRADASLFVAAMAEDITVTANTVAVVETTDVSANFDVQTIRELPTGRDIRATVLLAPGVTEGAVNNQITISGAMSFDNLFLVDGVVVNENLRGQPHDLFIEDAIQETTILTGGISAEFGHFTGGVVSTLTKSGGNDFSGSIRDTLNNPSWVSKSGYEDQVDPIDELNETYEGTLGGRLIRDRLWFFTAGRWEDRQTSKQLEVTEIPYVESREDRRWEAKITGQIAQKHTLIGSYLQSDNRRDNIITFGPVIDLRSLATREQPKTLFGGNYSGVLTKNLLFEVQVSRMDDDLTRGSETRDPIEGTLLLDESGDDQDGYRMWSPSGCGAICGVKQHDNKSWQAKASYFLSTPSLGTHSIVGGIDEFHQLRADNNFQSGSDFWIHGDIIQDPSDPTKLYFGIDPEFGKIEWDPVPALSKTSDFAVRSAFLNNKWELGPRWTFNIGARYDEAFGKNQAGVTTVDDSAFSPRLAATLDPQGNGRQRFSATYGRYVSKVEQGPADLTAPAGRYSYYLFNYTGPVINAPGTPVNQLLPTPQVIAMIFSAFNAAGGVNNTSLLDDISIPGATTRFDQSLQSPYMDEFTVGYALTFGDRGYVRADYIDRTWDAFYAIRRTLQTGKATDPDGDLVDQGVIENSRGGLSRDYQAVQLQGSWRPMQRVTVGGNYTWSKLRGNVEGESSGGATTLAGNPDKPEYTGFEENNPVGYLLPDMRHRGNLWVGYDLPTGFGDFNFSLLERYHSALSYSARGTIDVRQGNAPARTPNGVVNPGYVSAPSNVGYTFGERGGYRVDDISSTDLAINYALPFSRYRFFVETDIINIFNNQGVEDPDFVDQTVQTHRQTTTRCDGNTRCQPFNPLAGEKPVEGKNWSKGANFGKTTAVEAYQSPRTYRFSLGVRF
ncbi:MAG: carboxypeptidase regulatory-like domain-containing protein [Thermoanaerobaculia bacterium]